MTYTVKCDAPWTYDPKSDQVLDAKGYTIARVDGFPADGLLMAAAPDLLDAARDVVEQANKTLFPLGPDLADSIRVFLRRAIAKAEGRDQP